MVAKASFTVNDREPTPVAHTFVPRMASDPAHALFVEPGSVAAGDKVLLLKQRKTGSKYKQTVLFKIPVVATEVVNGISRPVVLRIEYFELTRACEDTSTLQERKNSVGMFYNMLASSQAMLDAFFTNLDQPY